MTRLIITVSFIVISNITVAQVWQWSVPVRNALEGKGDARAFLWIPENAKKVRAVILAQNNMEEQMILEHPAFRRAMAALGFVEIWVSPSFDHLFRFTEGAGDTFNGMMDDLAKASGYGELKYAPIVGLGHSAAASWPYYFAAWNPGRTLACISVSGQWPYFRSPVFAPHIWGNRNIDYVPCLETMGEYEAANTWSAEGLKERQEHLLMPLSMLACPAEGHFAASDKKIRYIALYIKKAAHYRLVKAATDHAPALLKPIDPTTTGWLSDKWRINKEPAAPAAPVGKYTGNPAEAFWFFDREMAVATERYESAFRNKKAQLLGYVQEGKTALQRNTHLQVSLRFLPEADGITFRLKGTFLDTVPGESPRPRDWTGLPIGTGIGHAATSMPVAIDKVIGPFEKINDTVFRLSPCRGLSSTPANYVLTFAATHPGDGEYKPAVQQGEMVLPARNREGVVQQIRFPDIANQRAGTKSLPLQAVSDAGVPVHYYVKEGPAEISGNELQFTKIPPRARFPVKVMVVAWQYGSSVAPKLQTAEQVERSFYLVK